jgi:hypothetical protein
LLRGRILINNKKRYFVKVKGLTRKWKGFVEKQEFCQEKNKFFSKKKV